MCLDRACEDKIFRADDRARQRDAAIAGQKPHPAPASPFIGILEGDCAVQHIARAIAELIIGMGGRGGKGRENRE